MLVRNSQDEYLCIMKTDAMRPLTVSLSPQQLARIQRAVESGSYASNSEVLREALRLWEHREDLRNQELEQLKDAYALGMASGASREFDAHEFLASVKSDFRS